MRRLFALGTLTAALLATPTTLLAQTPQASPPPDEQQRRPATTTVYGTTGIWYVPTGEVLPAGRWSASLYRTNRDDGQGFSDISTFPATFAYGLGGRAELFGSWALVTRVDRDARPLFFEADNEEGTGGGIVNQYPLVHEPWTGNKIGDFWIGGKWNLLAASNRPAAVAVRGQIKLPVGDDESGASSGKTDFLFDGIVSGYNRIIEMSGYGGVIFRGDPDGFDLTNGFRWGVGAAFPQRYSLGLRVHTEFFGEKYFDDVITAPATLIGTDGSVAPATSRVKSPAYFSLGLTWQAPNGFFVGASGMWNLTMGSRSDAGYPDEDVDDKQFEFRLGFHPGARDRLAPPPPPPPPPGPPTPAKPAAPVNRPPTVRALCDPCTVEIGRTATVTADAQDPDGDPLTYSWKAAAGSLTSPTSRQSPWTAPMQTGPVLFTVTVNDGRGGEASATVTINVIAPPRKQFTFEDVHFDFDRYTLRPDALRVLDEAVAAMKEDATLRLEIEGHTCNIGTNEYNLALGERRAHAVRDYLTSRGVSADRLRTVSYGEERPKHDNSREETRRLNRRAALVVNLK